jgi:hypothetical protein
LRWVVLGERAADGLQDLARQGQVAEICLAVLAKAGAAKAFELVVGREQQRGHDAARRPRSQARLGHGRFRLNAPSASPGTTIPSVTHADASF